MNFVKKDISNISNVELEWESVVKKTSYAWFWSTYYEHCFRLVVLKDKEVFIKDKSFFVYDDQGRLYGLAPLVFVKSCDFEGVEAYYDKPLPWPMIMDNVQNFSEVSEFIFTKIDEILKNNNVQKISLQYSPPNYENSFSKVFSVVMKKYKYIDSSHMSHCVDVSSDTTKHVRKRYKRYIKKYSNLFLLTIINKNDINIGVIRKYMELHIKDSGFFHRSLETYIAQFDYIVKGEGFVVQAKSKETGVIVGMLLICSGKKSAYDGSVAVDPDYQQYFISHLIKWKAIQYLTDIGIKHYELGKVSENYSYLSQPSKKNYGISFFKDGWSRGRVKKIITYEKYYSRPALDEFFNKKISNLINFFGV
jgi:hypothetical protein